MAALQSASGIPVIGMESPRGIADPSLGAFAEILAQADCVLLLDKRLDFTLTPIHPLQSNLLALNQPLQRVAVDYRGLPSVR